MELKDRLIKIISSEGLTSAAFADSIGVQRSSISHIVSGRNNPSLDFLQKILTSYPKYNTEWLIMGIGDIYKHPKQSVLFNEPVLSATPEVESYLNENIPKLNTNNNGIDTQKGVDLQFKTLKEEEKPAYNPPKQVVLESNATTNKKIEKIVVFYSDKTFGEYNPE